MPDITKQSVSASQAASLFNKSPWATRWMLHKNFADGMPLEAKENERMAWGLSLERVILEATASELRCEILPHDQSVYLRNPDSPVGCTPDGFAFDPVRGLGFIDAKNIDWLRWRDTWTETAVADYIEIQIQTQMMTPHPEFGMPKWGAVGALVGGNDLKIYERAPLADVQAQIDAEARGFLADVAAKREPDVLGVEIELPALTLAYPKSIPDLVLRESDFDLAESVRIARLIEEYEFAKDRESTGKKTAADLKAKLLAIAGSAGAIMVHGRYLDIKRWDVAASTVQRKASTTVKMTARLENLAADLDAILPPEREAKLDNIFAELDE